jgi:hypothetical protein
MSIALMNKVWEDGPSNRAARFVLLCLADHASEDGTDCHPSITRIADRCALSRQGVVNALDRLEESGWITRKKGGGRGNPNRYVLHFGADKQSTSFNKADKQSSSFNKADSEKGQPDTVNSQPHTDKGSTSLDGNHQGTTNNHQETSAHADADVRENDPPGVKVWVELTGKRPSIQTRQSLQDAFSGEDAPRWDTGTFRKALREAYLNVDRKAERIRIGYLLSSYEQHLSRGGDTVLDPDVEYNARGYPIR